MPGGSLIAIDLHQLQDAPDLPTGAKLEFVEASEIGERAQELALKSAKQGEILLDWTDQAAL